MAEMSQISSDHRLTYSPTPVNRNSKSGLRESAMNDHGIGMATGPRLAGQINHMEHRMFQRMPMAVDVIIYRDGLAVSAGQTHDLSLNGMFVESEKFAFPIHSVVEVRFQSLLDTECIYYHIPAIVVRRTDAGVGLELRSPAARDRNALIQMVRHAKQENRALA